MYYACAHETHLKMLQTLQMYLSCMLLKINRVEIMLSATNSESCSKTSSFETA